MSAHLQMEFTHFPGIGPFDSPAGWRHLPLAKGITIRVAEFR